MRKWRAKFGPQRPEVREALKGKTFEFEFEHDLSDSEANALVLQELERKYGVDTTGAVWVEVPEEESREDIIADMKKSRGK